MVLEVISGERGLDLEGTDYVKRLLESGQKVLMFPEKNALHPMDVYESVMQEVLESIKNGEDLFIVTYSEFVDYATRVAIKRESFMMAAYKLFYKDGNCALHLVTSKGKLSGDSVGFFDTTDIALNELLFC